MRIVLVGAPGSGKSKIAKRLKEDGYKIVRSPSTSQINKMDIPQGHISDYRYELLSLLIRTVDLNLNEEKVVFVHSPIDSVAYAAVMASRRLNADREDIENLKWLPLMEIMNMILVDSMKYDKILFVEGCDKEEFSSDIEDTLRSILDFFQLPYEILSGNHLHKAEEAAKILSQ